MLEMSGLLGFSQESRISYTTKSPEEYKGIYNYTTTNSNYHQYEINNTLTTKNYVIY